MPTSSLITKMKLSARTWIDDYRCKSKKMHESVLLTLLTFRKIETALSSAATQFGIHSLLLSWSKTNPFHTSNQPSIIGCLIRACAAQAFSTTTMRRRTPALILVYSQDPPGHRHSVPWYIPTAPKFLSLFPHDDRICRIRSPALTSSRVVIASERGGKKKQQ